MTFSPESFPVIFYAVPEKKIRLHDIQTKLLGAHRFRSIFCRTQKEVLLLIGKGSFSAVVTGMRKNTGNLLHLIREKQRFLPVILLGKNSLLSLPEKTAELADAYFPADTHTPEALAHRIAFHAERHLKNLCPDPLERNLLFPWTDLKHRSPGKFRCRTFSAGREL